MHSFGTKIKFSREVSTYLGSLSDLILTSNSCAVGFVFCTSCSTLALHRGEYFWEILYFTYLLVHAAAEAWCSQRTVTPPPAQHFLLRKKTFFLNEAFPYLKREKQPKRGKSTLDLVGVNCCSELLQQLCGQ